VAIVRVDVDHSLVEERLVQTVQLLANRFLLPLDLGDPLRRVRFHPAPRVQHAVFHETHEAVWSINRGVAGLIGVATSIGLVLTVLIVLALRATPGSADIGIGSMDVYRPNIDPVALVAIAAVTAVVGVAAAFVPARRAVRMDPLTALRHE
jgi:hypothetical protein